LTERGPYCAELSSDNGEPLAATASRIDHWFLIEYRGLWTRDALPGCGLSDQVKRELRRQVAAVPNGRLLFVRRPDRRQRLELLAFAASSRPGEERLTRLEFEEYDDLRGLDLRAGEPAGHPLFLVCTHGKHDPCCARHGRPLYEALRDELDPDWVWQSTHVGGDRFAGNLVCLPEGLYYGRVGREAAVSVLDEHLAGRIQLERYRGRSCYPFPVQAAERDIREETGLTGIGDLALEAVERRNGAWRVSFTAASAMHARSIERELGDLTLLTCNAQTPKRPRRFVASNRSDVPSRS
jgi:hypothetical protein